MNPEKIFILANLNSRTQNRGELEASVKLVQDKMPVEIIYTESAEDAREKARQFSCNPSNIVAACGGDGTINSVLQGISEQGTLAIIPSGTANVIARELGIPLNFRDACKNLLTGAVKKVDVGLCNGQRFLFVAGTGFDAQVAGNVSSRLKRLIGKFAYHLASVKELLSYKPPRLTFAFNNGQPSITGEFAIIANMRRYGGDLFFAPQARYDDGVLDLVIMKRFSHSALLRLFNFARKTAPFPEGDAIHLQAESFKVTSNVDCPYQLDGEVFAPTSNFYFTVNPQKINILIP